MNPNYIFWVALGAYAIHIIEEYTYDWKAWAQKIMKLDADGNWFYVNSAAMAVFGLACAWVGWSHPTFGLIFPAYLLADVLWFHILGYTRSKRKFSPGMMTGILLLLPIGISCFRTAADLGVQSKGLIIAG